MQSQSSTTTTLKQKLNQEISSATALSQLTILHTLAEYIILLTENRLLLKNKEYTKKKQLAGGNFSSVVLFEEEKTPASKVAIKIFNGN